MIPQEFVDYARRATADIDSRRARRDARDELIEHLMSSYESELATGATADQALVEVLERMGPARALTAPLSAAHTPRFDRRTLTIVIATGLCLLAAIWAAFYFYFLANFGTPS